MSHQDYSSLSRAEIEGRLAATALADQRGGRARGRRALVVGLLVAMLLALATAGDWYLRNREMGELLEAVEASEKVMVSAQDDIETTGREAMSQSSSPLTQQQISDVRAALSDAASHGASQVLSEGDAVRGVSVMPWHRSLVDARSRYVAHSSAWQDYLEGAARDPAEIWIEHPKIDGTFLSARRAFRRAIPPLALHDATARVDAIFAPADELKSSGGE